MKNSAKFFSALIILLALIGSCFIWPKLRADTPLKEALYYQRLEGNNLQCLLCPRKCFIAEGKRGYCGVRENQNGTLYTLVFAKPVAVHIDPIEKKPLFHFLPSTTAFSVATAGCNMKCKFCQNWEISQAKPEQVNYFSLTPQELIKKAKESAAPTIAYTYTEPTIFYEYMLECAKLAKEAGLKNVMHSNGYINEEPLRELARYLDGANIDLKGFSDEYYSEMTEGTLEPVLRSLKLLKEEGVHVEITNLILPGYNDDEETLSGMCLWIKENLGADTPLHFSRFFPMYKLLSLNPTPVAVLENARRIATECGLRYVFIGNVNTGTAENTYCPFCKALLIERKGYFILQNNIEGGKCKFCGEKISGVWNSTQDIKEPNVAGSFYPSEPQQLSALIDELLGDIEVSPPGGKIFALIQPHAGYGYSGKTAAYGYKLLRGRDYKTVVIIAPSHHYPFDAISIYPRGSFRTPLGDIEIDADFTSLLLDKDKEMIFEPSVFEKEHALEVQLPFLQRVISGFKIVPVVMGNCSLTTCKNFAQALKKAINSREDVLVIASTDMYHGYDYKEAEAVDAVTLNFIKDMDAEGLYYSLREGTSQLCGGPGVVTTLFLSKELGHDKLNVLDYTNSALVTGKKNKGAWTVGYVSCVIDADEEVVMLNSEQRSRLLEIARNSIETYLKTGKKFEPTETDPLLIKEMGAFVTLHKNSDLRGCIGNIIGKKPLYLTVRDMAVEAAFSDPRFPPLELSEFNKIKLEISVLSPLEKVDSVNEIQLGVHGVLVKKGFYSGVFLPQVATETGWSKDEFLSNLCAHKAGLSADAWKDKSTEIYIFSAEVFSE